MPENWQIIEVCFSYRYCFANDILSCSVYIFITKSCPIFVMVISLMKYDAKIKHESDWLLKSDIIMCIRKVDSSTSLMEMLKLLPTHETNKIIVDKPSQCQVPCILNIFFYLFRQIEVGKGLPRDNSAPFHSCNCNFCLL